jgi:hypothetical protein
MSETPLAAERHTVRQANISKMPDAFISYASEDRAEVALPLAKALQNNGVDVWFDQFRLNVGDSLGETIDAGLRTSRYGIVILSKHFFAKDWPRRELDALVSREKKRKRLLLPVWHGLAAAEVARHSPILATRYAAKTADGLESVVRSLLDAMGRTTAARDLTGLWAGRTGRMRLTQRGEAVQGDYDWKSLEWAGHVDGQLQGGVLRFTWRWDRSREHGFGFLVASLDGSEISGQWFYDDEEVDIDELVKSHSGGSRNSWSFLRVSGARSQE